MDMTQYQNAAMRTARNDALDKQQLLTNAALGLSGESGEFADLVKKHLFQGHTLDMAALKDELGDVLWYCALGATALGLDLGDVAARNVEKLWTRYPTGFISQRSTHREDEND